MATLEQKRYALFRLVFATDDTQMVAIRQCRTAVEVEGWLAKETRMGTEEAAKLAPVLHEALQDLTPR